MSATENHLIGKGTFGYVYDNIVKCQDKVITCPSNCVSKLQDHNAFLTEFKNLKAVKLLDKTGKFHALLIDTCEDPITSGLESFKPLKNKTYSALYLENAGITMPDYIDYHITDVQDIYNMFEKITGIITFVNILTQKQLVHFDITPTNMLIDLETNLIRLTDFGTLKTSSDLQKIDIETLLYPYRPPDVFFCLERIPSRQKYQTFITQYIDYCKQFSFTNSLFSRSIFSLFINSHNSALYNLYDKYAFMPLSDRLNIIPKKIDIYSIGITIRFLLEHISEKQIRINSFINRVLTQISDNCTAPDPENRISSQDLLTLYRNNIA